KARKNRVREVSQEGKGEAREPEKEPLGPERRVNWRMREHREHDCGHPQSPSGARTRAQGPPANSPITPPARRGARWRRPARPQDARRRAGNLRPNDSVTLGRTLRVSASSSALERSWSRSVREAA